MQLLMIYLTVPLMLCACTPLIELCAELAARGQK